jgi:hypothetical protein
MSDPEIRKIVMEVLYKVVQYCRKHPGTRPNGILQTLFADEAAFTAFCVKYSVPAEFRHFVDMADHPGPTPGDGSSQPVLLRHKQLLDQFQLEQAAVERVRIYFQESFPVHAFDKISAPLSKLMDVPLHVMFAEFLRCYATLRPADLLSAQQKLVATNYDAKAGVAALVLDLKSARDLMARGNDRPTEVRMLQLLYAAMPAQFAGGIQAHQQKHVAAGTDTFELASTMLEELETVIGCQTSSSDLGFAGSVAAKGEGSVAVFMYCWTCGGNWSHSSSTCRNPHKGHKKEATYLNKMRGNRQFCPPEGQIIPTTK